MSSTAAPRPLPSSNRILASGWAARHHAQHQDRLAHIKPTINTSAPACTKVKINRDKQRIAREHELERIDRDNRILLERMSLIQSKPSPDLPTPAELREQQANRKTSLNSFIRAQEQERILEENSALIARLKKGRGYFAPDEFSRHEKGYIALKEAASLARATPAPMPAPKFHPQGTYTALLRGAESDRPGSATGSHSDARQDSMSKSHSAAQLGRPRRPKSSDIVLPGGKPLSSVLAFPGGPPKRSPPKRPLAEVQDEFGPVKHILSDTYPQTHHHASQHSVQLKHDGRKKIDGRSVMITVEEMTAVAPTQSTEQEPSDSSSAAASSSSSNLIHAFLFRTYDHARLTHDFVSVPFSILSCLPECLLDPTLLDQDRREELAARMFGRLRFHEGRLAFNPSHALKVGADGDAHPMVTPSKAARNIEATPKKRAHATNSHAPTPATPAATTASASHSTPSHPVSMWDAITPDGGLDPSALSPAKPPRPASPDLDASPAPSRESSPAKGKSSSVSSHPSPSSHLLIPTTANLVRTGEMSKIIERTIRDRQSNLARKKDFESHIKPTPATTARGRSKSPTHKTTQPNATAATALPASARAAANTNTAATHQAEAKEES